MAFGLRRHITRPLSFARQKSQTVTECEPNSLKISALPRIACRPLRKTIDNSIPTKTDDHMTSKSLTVESFSPEDLARFAKLQYISDDQSGFVRQMNGSGFYYANGHG